MLLQLIFAASYCIAQSSPFPSSLYRLNLQLVRACPHCSCSLPDSTSPHSETLGQVPLLPQASHPHSGKVDGPVPTLGFSSERDFEKISLSPPLRVTYTSCFKEFLCFVQPPPACPLFEGDA